MYISVNAHLREYEFRFVPPVVARENSDNWNEVLFFHVSPTELSSRCRAVAGIFFSLNVMRIDEKKEGRGGGGAGQNKRV